MKNLQLFSLSRKAVNVTDEDARHIVFVNDKVYVLRDSVIYVYEDGPGAELVTIPCTSNHIIRFEYLPQEQLLWIGTNSGFISVNLETKEVNTLTIDAKIYESEAPFEFASWNPGRGAFIAVKVDGELGAYDVDFVQNTFKQKELCNLHDELYPNSDLLGWGSAETQFRSPEEIALRKRLEDERPVYEPDIDIKVSWRGSGDLYVLNYHVEGLRKIRVYRYPCDLAFESDFIVGFQAAIAWKPNGNWIAGVIRTNRRCQMAILERNCHIRCSYKLAKKAYVYDMRWSCSEILAVHQAAVDGCYTTIDLYSFNNYTMNLKQRLQFEEVNPLIEFNFLPSAPTLAILKATTLYEAITYTFKTMYHCSQTLGAKYATTISINGRKILANNCKSGIHPPPICDYETIVAKPVNFVTFNPAKPQVAVVDSCQEITLFDISDRGFLKIGSMVLKGPPGFMAPLKFHQFTWANDRIFCVNENPSTWTNNVNVNYLVLAVNDWRLTKTCTLEKGFNYSGYLEHKANVLASGTSSPVAFMSLKFLDVYIRSVVVDSNIYLFSLSSENTFFINEQEILQGVISFIVCERYLFITTADGVLYGVRLNKRALDGVINEQFVNAYCREVDIGAALICGIPDSSYIVTQIPRGNIEMSTCRLMSVDRIESLLRARKWTEAVDVVRVEKLNLNVLVDLNFDRFINSINQFIEAVSIPANLSEFLLILEDRNIFSQIYKNCAIGVPVEKPNKRNLICDAMIKYMKEHNHFYYINSIITACFVKDSPTHISEALHYVQSLLDRLSYDPSIMSPAEEAFKSACVLKSTKDIYETALLTYDLDLILFVARNTDMDPLEFEPFVKDLKGRDTCHCRFKINDHLGRHIQAFSYLIRMTEHHDQIFNYVKEHELYEQALWSLKPGTRLYCSVCSYVGEVLQDKGKYEEALIFFKRANLFEDAMNVCKRALLWRQAAVLMKEVTIEWPNSKAILRNMAEELRATGKALDASKIYEKHLDDYETAIMTCIGDKLFVRAIKLANKYGRITDYESEIAEEVCAFCMALCDKFQEMLDEFNRHKARLLALRLEKKTKYEDPEDWEIVPQLENLDEVGSIITTTTLASTTASTSTRTSSRSRRKRERKKHSLRLGSIFEDIALLETIYKLVEEAFEWGPKARELCLIILELKNLSTPPNSVIMMYNALVNLQGEMKAALTVIWPPHMNNIDGERADIAVFKNINILDMKYRSSPENTNVSWKLDAFPCV